MDNIKKVVGCKHLTVREEEDGRLRFREDHFIEPDGTVSQVRSRLTLIGQSRKNQSPQQDVLLSRSRYFAPATQSLRFYIEYFKPKREIEIELKIDGKECNPKTFFNMFFEQYEKQVRKEATKIVEEQIGRAHV